MLLKLSKVAMKSTCNPHYDLLSLTQLSNFSLHSVRLPPLSLRSPLPLAEMVTNQRHGAGTDQRLQTVGVAAQPAQHAEAPAAGVLVLGEVVQQAGHDARVNQSGTRVRGVGEARKQQQDGRLRRPGLRVVRVVVRHGAGGRGRGVKSDF